jgi:hypothetical protein
MFISPKKYNVYLLSAVAVVAIVWRVSARSYIPFLPLFTQADIPNVDSPENVPKIDSLKYPITDRRNDKFNEPTKYEFDLKDPSNLVTDMEYDTTSGTYSISEKMGGWNYRNPSYMSLSEYLTYKGKMDETEYWKKRQKSVGIITKKGYSAPQVDLGNAIFDRLFGSTKIEVKPTGNLEVSVGGNWQNVQNPALPLNQRKWGIFDFDVQPNIGLTAKVGDKMRMNFNYNSRATFDFENQTKLQWTGQPDQIIRSIDLGQVNFPLKSTLIQGVQGLFGIKVQAQFGRLMMTNVISQQKSRKESITLKNGAQTQEYAIQADQYDINRHFLLDQQFRNNYNKALSTFPLIQSQANIVKMEVWVTNRTAQNAESRDVIAFADLGEPAPYLKQFEKAGAGKLASNDANMLYPQLLQQPGGRAIGTAVNSITAIGLQGTRDFEKTFARKLLASEYSFNPKLGFISLNTYLNPDDVVGVAYQYTFNGRTFQVGEFAQDLPPDTLSPKVLYLKMLKSTTLNPTLPIWDLMMKNVYALGGSNIAKEEFRLNVFYQDAAGALKQYIPEGPKSDTQLIRLVNLDRLNNQNDPQVDGVFDFVEGVTILANQGKIIFPVLEPFGNDLKHAFGGNVNLEKKYLYTFLYDSTQIIAQQYPQFNRFLIKGQYKGTGGSEIYLGGFNIPPGSVRVSAGGQQLVEGTDYTVDYGIGRLKILNTGVLSSGAALNVSYENNANFSFQQQNLVGSRLDYYVNEKMNIGGTFMRLNERPFTNKVSFGDDPIKNTVLGLDVNYQSEVPAVTRLADKLPIYSTTAPSLLNAFAEGATIIPGYSRLIQGANGGGEVYVDDFESSRSSYDLKFPLFSWALASPPTGATDKSGKVLFPEAADNNSLSSGKNRALINWYNLEPSLTDFSQVANMPDHLKNDKDQLSDPYIHPIRQQDVFPQRSIANFNANLVTFDLGFYPNQRGQYNFDDRNITADGILKDPSKRWGGITRYIDQSDFEATNVEFIEFWIMDPFLKNTNSNGGSLYINLGNISEDVLKDSRKGFENGIPYPYDVAKMEQTVYGQVPRFQQQINISFDNNLAARTRQDVGYDCMDSLEEADKYSKYLTSLQSNFGATSGAYINAVKDPANDNYKYVRGEEYDNLQASIFERYKRFNSVEGNSPVNNNSSVFSNSFTNIPENEDINRDNTLNETESYFQYRVDLKPNMVVGQDYLISRQTSNVSLPNGTTRAETWYQFRVPIKEFNGRVGNISDFRSIRFFRMFLTGFEDSVVLRFARIELGRNTWRKYNYSLKNPGEIIPEIDNSATEFNLTSVSIEENASRQPVPYATPPGIIRQQQQISNGQNIFLNEQSMSMQICGLEDGDAKGAFKPLGIDMRQFKKLRMFVHAEQRGPAPLANNDLRAFMRLGTDFNTNYYEYQIPLKVTTAGTSSPELIWPVENEMDLTLQDLVDLKFERDKAGAPVNVPYSKVLPNGHIIKLIGSPNFAEAKTAMLGVYNPRLGEKDNARDDGLTKCAEVWFNELRLSDLNNKGGYAATGNVDLQVADLMTLRASGNMHTQGYGNIDQKLQQRLRDNAYQYAASANINAGKLFPKNWGVTLPMYIGQNSNVSTPQYNPYNQDQELKKSLSILDSKAADSLLKNAQDAQTTQSFNVTNVRFQPVKGNTKPKAKAINKNTETNKKGESKNEEAMPNMFAAGSKLAMPWAISNFNFSYSYSNVMKRSPLLVFDNLKDYNGAMGYAYSPTVKSFEPFKKKLKSKNKKFDRYLTIIRDFNVKPLPSNITFNTDVRRVFGQTQIRNLDEGAIELPTTFYKYFTWNRQYSLRWSLTNNLSFDINANNNSRIDEPDGYIDTRQKRDSVLGNAARLGRTTMYSHSFNSSYNVPINKIPILDWVTLRASFNGTYNWTAASLLARNLGNTVANTQVRNLNGDFNFVTLYNKWGFLRKANQPKPIVYAPKKPASKTNEKGKDEKGSDTKKGANNKLNKQQNSNTEDAPAPGKTKEKETDTKVKNNKSKKAEADSTKNPNYRAKLKALEKQRKKEEKEKRKKERAEARKRKGMSDGLRYFGRFISSVKRANFTYSENLGSTLPGYMDSTLAMGVNWRTDATQLPYAFGFQPDRNRLDYLGGRGLMSRDSFLNTNFQSSYNQTLNITATVEPIKDLNIALNWKKTFNKAYNELYKDSNSVSGLSHLNPFETGGFSISYISFRTLFQDTDKNGLTKAFYDFENNRKIISNRLGAINPYTAGVGAPEDPGYAKGYTRYAQEVLIPSFLAAFSGKDAATYPLLETKPYSIRSNPFKHLMPMPNWNITYNGLTKLEPVRNLFTNVSIKHGYSGELSMNSFNSSLFYRDQLSIGYPSFIDSNSGNFVPYFFVPNMTITERFEPLIGIDIATKNNATFHFEYKQSRTLTMSLVDFQLSNLTSKEIVVGAGMRLKKVKLPISLFDLNKKKNDMNIKFDFSLRDDNMAIQIMDRRESRNKSGNTIISITPSIDYIYSQNLTVRLYYDRRQSIPHTTQSFPITATRGGVMFRFLLGQ